jgi:hypothetical protein
MMRIIAIELIDVHRFYFGWVITYTFISNTSKENVKQIITILNIKKDRSIYNLNNV